MAAVVVAAVVIVGAVALSTLASPFGEFEMPGQARSDNQRTGGDLVGGGGNTGKDIKFGNTQMDRKRAACREQRNKRAGDTPRRGRQNEVADQRLKQRARAMSKPKV